MRSIALIGVVAITFVFSIIRITDGPNQEWAKVTRLLAFIRAIMPKLLFCFVFD